jgi:integrase
VSSTTSTGLRPLPYPGFPLRRHANGTWYKSLWNARTKKTEQFYFGSWRDDPKGERAMGDPQIGWLARRDSIKAGIDNVRVTALASDGLTLGELMARFLIFKRDKAKAGELSLATLGDYLREIERFVNFMKPAAPAAELKPEHFDAYMRFLIEERKLGRHARKRVRSYVTALFRYGSTNGWIALPTMGTAWAAPATDADSMRQAKARAGIKDYSERIVTGAEIDRLMARANPTFKAMILLGVNTGLGPADLGRLRWEMIDLKRGRLIYPRFKTGTVRVGYLWQRTREALLRVQSLKHNHHALENEGQHALVFLTRKALPFYREREVRRTIEVDGKSTTKLAGIAVENSVSITFSRIARELKMTGLSFYRLRHSFRTYAKRAHDRESIDLMMGHRDGASSRIYDHDEIDWRRIRRVARIVHHRLWPELKREGGKQQQNPSLKIVGGDALGSEAA